MGYNKTSQPKLAIVIHTEEEFDWNGGFYRSNNAVTHANELITFCEKLIAIGAKITFALDYAFVDSEQGKRVVGHFKKHHLNNVEFATHLHPWVNPPFADNDKVSNYHSYPGNLTSDIEFEKLKLLTQKIEEICGIPPTTYLAGRYGTGKNTLNHLKELGYNTDVSISPFCNFTHQEGPDFSRFNNNTFEKNNVIHWPHTTAIVSLFPFVEKWFNRHPEKYEKLQLNIINRIILKLLRVKRQRLSPEGFELSDLKKITQTQLALGHNKLILSFHSPSVKKGLTPYVQGEQQTIDFYHKTTEYIQWFISQKHGKICTIQDKALNNNKSK